MNDEHKDFLNGLRDSGGINMFGAAPVLADAFDIDLKDAVDILSEWMRQY